MNNLIRNIAIDIFIISSIWSVLNNSTYKLIFGISASAYILKKYV